VSSPALAWRMLPAGTFSLARGNRLLARNARVTMRIWWVPASGLFEPMFYLLSIGIGLGKLVGHLPGPGGRLLRYQDFIAPGMLAASAMNGAVYESVFGVFFKLKYAKVYDAVLATPLDALDVAKGEVATALLRIAAYATAFVVVMAALGDVGSAWAAFDLPAAVLVGFAFSAAGMAATAYMRSWTDFDLVLLVQLPFFLFSTTFYPLSTYPRWLQIVVELTPLYHGVELERALTVGAVGPALIGHAAYLLVMGAVAMVVAGRRIRRLLLS
jgi:lipooligosaccharide transport system permease protein